LKLFTAKTPSRQGSPNKLLIKSSRTIAALRLSGKNNNYKALKCTNSVNAIYLKVWENQLRQWVIY